MTATIPLPQPVLGLPDPGERVPPVAWPTVVLYVGTLALAGATAYGVLAGGWSPWLTVPLAATVTFLMFSVMHESTHHAISTRTPLNDAFGHLSVPFVAPYASFPMITFIHIEHHRNTNESKSVDPDAWTSEGPWWQLPFRWATIDGWYLVYYLRRAGERPRAELALTVAIFTGVLAGVGAALTAGYAVEVATLLAGQRLGLMVLAWWFDYLPHHGLTATQREDRYRATRVRVGAEGVLTPLFVYQNYHLVHHLHPSVPFYRYVRAWRRNEQAYLDRNVAISTWFGRSLTPSEYRTWRRLTDDLGGDAAAAGAARRPTFHQLRVAAVERLTDDSVVVSFAVPADLAAAYRYTQGQHVTLRAMIDGQDVRRSYSLVAPATEESPTELRVAIKRIEGGVFSTYAHRDLRPGDILDVMTPAGRFHAPLDPTRQRRYAAVAAGSGITPLMSIIATTLEVEPRSTLDLVYGNRTAASTMFLAELDALVEAYAGRLVVHHVRSREAGASRSGRITPELVRELVPGEVDVWFLCGPQELVDTLAADLGGPDGRGGTVLTEVFHAEGTAVAAGLDLESQVTVRLDGDETRFALRSAGDSILDAALQQGLQPPYSCAGGACGTCRAKVLLGRAVMDQNHALPDEEVEAGYVLTCQAHPVSEELRVDYDA